MFYFIISSYLRSINNKSLKTLNEINSLIIELSEDVSDDNLKKIIKYFQINKIECNNDIIDKIFYETNEKKKAALIKRLIKIINLVSI